MGKEGKKKGKNAMVRRAGEPDRLSVEKKSEQKKKDTK